MVIYLIHQGYYVVENIMRMKLKAKWNFLTFILYVGEIKMKRLGRKSINLFMQIDNEGENCKNTKAFMCFAFLRA